jgi:5S rRNA maturation endonuclease (ribonuclease M5)
VNIVEFLHSVGYELVKCGNTCYKGKIHNSLVIHSDGRWYWNGLAKYGESSVELYKQILLADFGYTDEIEAAIEAIKQLAGSSIAHDTIEHKPPPVLARPPNVPLKLPEAYRNSNRVWAYLVYTRRLDPDIVQELIRDGKIYEDIRHNAVFVAYDEQKRPQNAFLRGTLTYDGKQFKKDVELSNKSYPFTLSGYANSDRVICFEGAADAIAHATIHKSNGLDWRTAHRISLNGVAFCGLERFLRENRQVTKVSVALDNDEAGNRASEKIIRELANKGYDVDREAPKYKDFNCDLVTSTYDNDDFEQEMEAE